MPLFSSNCCSLQLALTTTVYLMFGLSTCSTKKCGLQKTDKMTYSSVIIRNSGMKLCQVKCVENCFSSNFKYINETLECAPARDEPKKNEKTGGVSVHPKKFPDVPTKPCASKVCDVTSRSGSGKAVCVKATSTPSPCKPGADSELSDACHTGDLSAVRRILSEGRADINCWKNLGSTPVMRAAAAGHRDVVELLVSKGADLSVMNRAGCNILHVACWRGQVEVVKYVLSQGMVKINCRGWKKMTPVMMTAHTGRREVMKLLVGEGADVSLVDSKGDNILHLACWRGKMEVVKYVLSQGLVNIDARGWMKQTAVMRAAWNRHREVMKLLVSKGADLTLVDSKGENILHLACRRGYVEVVKYVLSLNMVDINVRNYRGHTATMMAVFRKHRNVHDLLVSPGARV
ncbi:ankyrin homolog [Haliotis cracherodii]|uniref:ankyrin homolog n=1 Tax=Haliotis cracherodii TaxID=6455 RepID=UPI0039EB74BF